MIDSHVSLSVRVVRETRLPANTVFKAAKHDRGHIVRIPTQSGH